MGLPAPSADASSSTTTAPQQQQKAALEETYTQAARSSTQAAPATDVPSSSSSSSSSSSDHPLPSTAPLRAPTTLPIAALDLASKIFDYARYGNTPGLAQYLAAGIPPNLTNSTGDTLLMLAAYHGHAATVAELLRRGADPDALNDKGQSPLAGAVFKGHSVIVHLLVELGCADVRAGQPNAIDCARMFRRTDMLALFGADEAA